MELDRRIKEAALGIGVTVIITPFLIDGGNAVRVITALTNGKVDCGAGVEPESRSYPFDAIVVPGAGTVTSEGGNEIPAWSEAMRLTAAAFAFQQKLAPKVILLDGESGDGIHNQTKAYLQNEVKQLTDNASTISDDAIITEDASINTATNMKALAELAKKHTLKKVLILTNAYHQARATLLACANGIPATPLTVEEELIAHNANSFQPRIQSMYTSPLMGRTLLKEKLEVLWLLWDPKGSALTRLAQMKKR